MPDFPGESAHTLEERAMQLGTGLGEAGQQLLASLPQPVRSPSELVRVMGLNKVIASRLLAALGKRDPMAVVFYLPGMDTLRRITEAARERGAKPEAVRQWSEQVALLDDFLKHEVGGKQGLDAIASAVLPDARERFEMSSRQSMYKGAANFYGATCAIELLTFFIHPSQDGDSHDVLILNAMIGLRRLRLGKPLPLSKLVAASAFTKESQTAPASASLLDGRPWRPVATPMLMSEFCSKPMPEIASTVAGRNLIYQLVGEDVGLASACDIYFCQYMPHYGPLPPKEKKPVSLYSGARTPAQRVVFDVLIHRDVWKGIDPRLHVMGPFTYERGSLRFEESDFDQIDVIETIRPLGQGSRSCRVSEIPRYVEAIDTICAQRGWDPAAFRGYRCDSRYPIWGAQYYMVFGSPDTAQ